MRWAVISDVHGNGYALEAVIRDMKEQKVDQVIFLGDLTLRGPQPHEAYQMMVQLAPAIWLKGNGDMWMEQVREDWERQGEGAGKAWQFYQFVMRRLPRKGMEKVMQCPLRERFMLKKRKAIAVHGSPRSISVSLDDRLSDEALWEVTGDMEEQLIICGNGHRACIREIGGKRVFNAGSVGAPYDNDWRAAYGILDDKGKVPKLEIRRVEYDREELLWLARKVELPFYSQYEESIRNGVLVV